jgi:hypothetical protein
MKVERRTKAKPRTQSKTTKQKVDGRRRRLSPAIDAPDRRDIREAFAHGQRIGYPLNCAINFHPVHMHDYPEGDLGVWFKDELRNRMTTWLRRRGIRWHAVWMRENYVGDRREHIHLLINCPIHLRDDLLAAIRRWYPGTDDLVTMGPVTWRKHPKTGFLVCAGLEYRLKQMTARAWGPPRPGRPRRETESRHDRAPVAPVMGRRHGVSDTLNQKARDEWQAARDAEWDARLDLSPTQETA